MRNNIVLENELFYCEHIPVNNKIKNELAKFTVEKKTGNGLVNYLLNYALEDEKSGEMRTYLVRDKDTNEIAGYFSLKSGMVSVNERGGFFHREFDSVAGIELANFAVNNSYKESHNDFEGIGKIIFYYFIMPIVKNVSGQIGVRMLFIFSLPYENLMSYYRTLHFERLSTAEEYFVHKRIKPRYDKNCVFIHYQTNKKNQRKPLVFFYFISAVHF